MGLFDFLKKKENKEVQVKNEILLAMPMFQNGETFQIADMVAYLKSFWNLDVSKTDGDSVESHVLTINGEMVAIMFLPMPIPWDDIQDTARYAYNWSSAAEDLKSNTGHAIVSLMSSNSSNLDRFTIFSKVLSSILATSNAVGIYQGSQTLLLQKEMYLQEVLGLKEVRIPVSLWAYIGIRSSESGNSVYTYGLKSFQKQEIEIINSSMDLGALYDFIVNISAYVIGSNVTLKHGETLGVSAEQKIKITSSKGVFIEGETLKLAM